MVADWSLFICLLYKTNANVNKHLYMPARHDLLEDYSTQLVDCAASFFHHTANLGLIKEKYHVNIFQEIEEPMQTLSAEKENYLTLLATVLKIRINVFFTTTQDIFSFKQLFVKCITFKENEEYKRFSQIPLLPDLQKSCINLSFANGEFSILDEEMSNFLTSSDMGSKIVKSKD